MLFLLSTSHLPVAASRIPTSALRRGEHARVAVTRSATAAAAAAEMRASSNSQESVVARIRRASADRCEHEPLEADLCYLPPLQPPSSPPSSVRLAVLIAVSSQLPSARSRPRPTAEGRPNRAQRALTIPFAYTVHPQHPSARCVTTSCASPSIPHRIQIIFGMMKQHSVAIASAAGPSRAQPSAAANKLGAKNSTGIGGLPGGVVGPEAAGLDPSGPEHFFVTLAAYADALDALPLDLTRSFSDLRELDAVLGSHLNSLTARLNHLTALIEDPDIDQGQRLLALKEVAEEARAYKMGGEDKIRVALNTAETIISHTDYIDALDSQLDRFAEISALLNPTKHLKLEQYYVPGALKDRKLISTLDSHTGAAGGASGADANGASGSKKKKVAAQIAAASAAGGKSHRAGDASAVSGSAAGTGPSSSSKKRKAISGAAVSGSGSNSSSKVAKTAASGKGDDDVKSAANGSSSHKKKTEGGSNAGGSGSKSSQLANSNTRLPRAAHAHSGYTEDDEDGAGARKDGSRRAAGVDADESSANRSRNSRSVRASAAAQRSDDEDDDLDDGDVDEEEEAHARSNTKSRSRAGRTGASNSRARGGAAAANSPHTGSTSASRAESPSSTAGGAGDDADEARYCFCNNVSYGDMIGCDDDDCEREWFHLGCVGLTKPPQGTWYCEACLERRANARAAKSKKSKSSGGSKSKVRR